MALNLRVCLGCLRTDKPLRPISSVLVEFHNKQCNYCLPYREAFYCKLCEHLLRKFYKFNFQLTRAFETYSNWKSTKVMHRPLVTTLHKNIPTANIGHWLQSPNVKIIRIKEKLGPKADGKKEGKKICKKILDDEITDEEATDDTDESENDDKDLTEEDSHPILKNVVKINDKNDKKLPIKDVVKSEKDEKVKYLTVSLEDIMAKTNPNKIAKVEHDHSTYVKYYNGEVKDEDGDDDITNWKNEVNDNNEVSDDGSKVKDDMDADDYLDVEVLDEDILESFDDDSHGEEKKRETAPVIKPIIIRRPRESPKTDLEKLHSDLAAKFALCDHVISADGTPIEADKILKSLTQRKIKPMEIMKLPRILKDCPEGVISEDLGCLLNTIHITLKEEAKYEQVFDIQYHYTDEQMQEEFDNRLTYACYANAEFKCEMCRRPFRNEKYLKNHTETYHDDKYVKNVSGVEEKCQICNLRILTKTQKTTHGSSHREVFKCKICPAVLYCKGTMQTHFECHMGKIYKCDLCDAEYTGKSGYYLHKTRDHKSGRDVCTTCGRGFGNKHGLSNHSCLRKIQPIAPSADEETGEKESVRCEECDVTFPSASVLRAHVKDCHTISGKKSLSPEAAKLRVYKKNRQMIDDNGLPIYHGEYRRKASSIVLPPVKCRLCDMTRRGSVWLFSHFKKEHPDHEWDVVYADLESRKTHLCDVCGRSFAKVYQLRDHRTIHTGVRPFPCDLCSRSFRSSKQMRDHRVRHFPPQYTCDECGRSFKSKSNLFNHSKMHTNERAHVCKLCGKGFNHAANLREHVNGVHYNIRRCKKKQGADDTPPVAAKRQKKQRDNAKTPGKNNNKMEEVPEAEVEEEIADDVESEYEIEDKAGPEEVDSDYEIEYKIRSEGMDSEYEIEENVVAEELEYEIEALSEEELESE